MTSLDNFTFIMISIGFLLLGMLFQYLLKNKKGQNWEEMYGAADKENTKLNKSVVSQEKKMNQLISDRDRLKKELESIKAGADDKVKNYQDSYETVQSELSEANNELNKLKSDHNYLQNKYDKLNETYTTFKSKYDEKVGLLKGATQESNKLGFSNTQLKDSYEKLKLKYAKDKKELDAFKSASTNARATEKELRILKAKANKLTKDVEYWEKKHYDTHHELAAVTKSQDATNAQIKELKEFRAGDKIIMDNLKTQIQQYKDRYLEVNTKYNQIKAVQN